MIRKTAVCDLKNIKIKMMHMKNTNSELTAFIFRKSVTVKFRQRRVFRKVECSVLREER